MTAAFDPRILILGIQLEDGIHSFKDLTIRATGTRFGNGLLNECEATIFNLTKAHRNYLLTQTSLLNQQKQPKLMTLDAGRQSYGTFRLYQGNVIAGCPTQPPDIGITFRALTGAFYMGNLVATAAPSPTQLSTISGQVAGSIGANLQFSATDKQIDNFAFTGAALKQIDKLGQAGQVDAYLDNGTLYVKNQNQPLPGAPVLCNASTGMVGVPEVNEYGVKVKMMLNNQIQLGGQITIQSQINPAANGTFTIFKLGFEIANREEPFYYNIEASNYTYLTQGQ